MRIQFETCFVRETNKRYRSVFVFIANRRKPILSIQF